MPSTWKTVMKELQGKIKKKPEEDFFPKNCRVIAPAEIRYTGRELGEGTHNVVLEAEWQGKLVAIKQPKPDYVDTLKSERDIQFTLDHENLLKGYGVLADASIVNEYAPRGDLFAYIDVCHGVIPNDLCRSILYGVASGVKYMHEQDVLHFDLKSDNVFLDDALKPKVGDFGLALRIPIYSENKKIKLTHLRGSLEHFAPENFDGIYSKKSESYSIACLAFELLSGSNVFGGQEDVGFVRGLVKKGKRGNLDWLRLNPDPAVLSVMEKGWAQNEEDRPDLDEIVEILSPSNR